MKMMKFFGKKETATDVTTIDVSNEVETDDHKHTRIGWWIVLGGVGGFFLWACFAPLDQGVPMQGTVMVSTNRKAIQHQTGGTIQEILVKDGDVVKAGQVLVKMNEIQAKSQSEISRVQFYTARAAVARLTAERDEKKSVSFPDDLIAINDDARVKEIIGTQNQLFTSRQSAIKNELGSIDENIAGLRAQVKGLIESKDSKKQQADFLKEQLVGMRGLAKEGYVPRNRLLELERTFAQINGAISEDIGNIGRTQRQITELTLRRIQRQQEYQKEVRTQLSDAQKEAEGLDHRLKSLDYDLANTLVRAPVDGTVVGLSVFTHGGVVPAGFKMMDVVPSDDTLIVEGQVPVHLIDKVHPDLEVDLIFSAFSQRNTPHIPGVVMSVSADRLVDEKTGTPYYKLKAKVLPSGIKMLAQHEIRAGMPVDLFVKTGERTMMNYLLKPVFDRANMALKEE
jgi:membrane fusion protein, protease secretion system